MNLTCFINRLSTDLPTSVVGIVLFGSAAHAIKGHVDLFSGSDIDLLFVVRGRWRAALQSVQTLQNALPDKLAPVDLIVVKDDDFNSRLYAGDPQLISILASGILVRDCFGLAEWQRRARLAHIGSGVDQIQRLLSEADRILTRSSDDRSIGAALIAASQAVLIAAGVQPGSIENTWSVMRVLSETKHAPQIPSVIWQLAEAEERRVAARQYVGDCCRSVYELLRSKYFPARATGRQQAPVALFIDVGGVLIGKNKNSRNGVAEALLQLSKKYKLVAISNAASKLAQTMHQLGLAGYFDHLVISEKVKTFKPEVAIYNIGLERLNLLPTQALMVGDSLHTDICGAWRAGLPAIWFRPSNRFAKILRPNAAIVTDLRQLTWL